MQIIAYPLHGDQRGIQSTLHLDYPIHPLVLLLQRKGDIENAIDDQQQRQRHQQTGSKLGYQREPSEQ
jgi:hypothetical protein